ncbi:ParA family protein, partial [Vogesella mureinivorans]|uniref:ParA family protein n=1 Tax=Vogesella mureinivorans TaxID=657276 RepID=UPI0011C85166
MLITVANQKGGCGKTTIAIHLAHAIALAKKRVLLVDADPQASAGGWAAVRGEETPFVVVGMARETLHRDLPAMMEGFDHGVID